ncbi:MAG: 2,5-dioxopentanoate dehydrogenase [Verrucomicrobiota bacterium]|jgi:NADP-dependent aldehyde dehydrogenase|nr:2,5-dioxopentanoate dehydrogenase [Verrucomicrobiota bacterium]
MPKQLETVVEIAAGYRSPGPEVLSAFLERIGEEIIAVGEKLISICAEETALSVDRLVGERARTVNQLKMFANLVREGSWVDARIDTALPERKPLPRPDLRRILIPLGPVAVFGASNFPLAFSVAGGDTASALAAGCPVVVKPHPGHPRTSALTAAAVLKAAKDCQMPDGGFAIIEENSVEIGLELVRHPLIKAVGFTGSTRAGRALFEAANSRPDPIPVFAEMGSLNPLFVLPGALENRWETIATGLAGSVALGTGQFCTKPGLVIAPASEAFDRFSSRLGEELAKAPKNRMLNETVSKRFEESLSKAREYICVEGGAFLLVTDGKTFGEERALHEEIFGPATLLVKCENTEELLALAAELEGQLTATIHSGPGDEGLSGSLLSVLQEKVGRIVWNGYPTGVEVSPSMHHGGPYPATTDSRFTSVGTAAIQRFARPVCYQGLPHELLPTELQNANARKIWRLVNGTLTKDDITA